MLGERGEGRGGGAGREEEGGREGVRKMKTNEKNERNSIFYSIGQDFFCGIFIHEIHTLLPIFCAGFTMSSMIYIRVR